ncbi:fused MFS/spermidine synthase, partial [Myxococcota bacterium]|nr:fused MFS/spermidine synthase [Myxococcota bacterium]
TSPFYQSQADAKQIHFQAAGRSSTVVLLEEPSGFILYTNGLPESRIVRYSSTPERGAEARALGWLPAALRPEAKRGLVIGLGGAVALEGIPPFIDSVDVIELEPEVVTANRQVSESRLRDPLSDPRFRFIQNDARGALTLAQEPYDMIISQPSHPWTAGASHLYTQEFFELVEERLTPDGVFVQWIGLGFIDAPLLRSLLATLTAVFPEVQIYRPHGPALVFIASNTPLDLNQSERALELDPLHFKQLGIRSPSEIAAAWVLDTDGARTLAQGAAPNTDDWNQLATRSSRLQQGALTVPQFNALVRSHDPLRGHAETVAPLPLILSLAQRGEIQRAAIVARELDGVDRPLALALIAAMRGKMGRARQRLQQARSLAPDSPWVEEVAELLAMPLPEPPSASGSANTIRRAQEQAERQHWNALAQLDSELAQIAAGELLYGEALRLRALWRVEGSDRQKNEEAIALIDERLAYSSKGGAQLERARAAAGAGRTTEAWVTLDQALGKLMAAPRRHAEELSKARLLARELPDDPEAERVRERLSSRPSRPPSGD